MCIRDSCGRGEFHLFAAAHVQVVLVAFERAGADLQEGDAVPLIRVHVGVDLEDEACHFRLGRLYDPGFGRCGARRGGDADETLQEQIPPPSIICSVFLLSHHFLSDIRQRIFWVVI